MKTIRSSPLMVLAVSCALVLTACSATPGRFQHLPDDKDGNLQILDTATGTVYTRLRNMWWGENPRTGQVTKGMLRE